jgi:serralysin
VSATALALALSLAGRASAEIARIEGGPGADMLTVGSHAALVAAMSGDDHVTGSPEADDLSGNEGNDTLNGAGGPDTLHGGRGKDSLSGGAGDDLLAGERGDDTLTGGPGADKFVLAPGGGQDLATDFSVEDGDMVQVEGDTQPEVQTIGEDTLLRLPDGSTLLLKGVAAATLSRSVLTGAVPTLPAFGEGAARSSPVTLVALAIVLAAVCVLAALFIRRRN